MNRDLPSLIAQALHEAERLLGSIGRRNIATLIYFGWASLAVAQTNAPAPALPFVLTNIKQIWDVSGEAAREPQRIKTEVVIYYCDPNWNCAWSECEGKVTFLPIFDSPVPLQAGQRVAIDGLALPFRQRFVWDKTSVQVREQGVQLKPLELADLSRSAEIKNSFRRHPGQRLGGAPRGDHSLPKGSRYRRFFRGRNSY
jgi:hypothetical protein